MQIILGGGCFWCLQSCFELLPNVNSVVCGYAGGITPNPTYEEVCSGQSIGVSQSDAMESIWVWGVLPISCHFCMTLTHNCNRGSVEGDQETADLSATRMAGANLSLARIEGANVIQPDRKRIDKPNARRLSTNDSP